MSNVELINKIALLPDNLKEEISKLIDSWLSENPSKNKRILGLAKGKIRLKDNFDDPIDDFKDYQ
ncbi:MAG: DUF2281 domain-containing protein [Bacteroidia bacterium]